MKSVGMPRGAAIAINDMLDNVGRVKAGDEVVILAHVDGLYGGDNLVDEEAIAWLQAAVHNRGANPSVLWIEEPDRLNAWRVPPVMVAALSASNVFIANTFNYPIEEMKGVIQEVCFKHKVVYLRNFATTAALLNSRWAQTPTELVAEIRYQAAVPFGNGGMPYQISGPAGTCLEGMIGPVSNPAFTSYSMRRTEGYGHRPFPEWVFPAVTLQKSNGTVVFERMLSWWSRYIGISSVFEHPIRLTIKDGRIIQIEGKTEADALRRFLQAMEDKVGDSVYDFSGVHSGVHPNAVVSPQECSHPLITRIVDHANTCNVHFHIGSYYPTPSYPYYLHMTADVRNPTWKVGGQLVHDRGHLVALDHPMVKQVAAKYPDRPGLEPGPRTF